MLIPIALREGRYDVQLEPTLAGLGEALAGRFPPGRCALVTNPVVAALHADAAEESLRRAGWSPLRLEVPDGEAHKDVQSWMALVDALLDARLDRKTPVLALGGGVTGDLVGFAAATVQRGVPLVQVPTTLLAMVDSSVGGKTGVNTRHGKNLLGAFHQPSLVYAALGTLHTLPDEELRGGLGEVVKHAVIAGEDCLANCERLAPKLLDRDEDALARVVADSVRTKARIVEEDPRELGVRALLNLGHTLGHAVETVSGYGTLRHGEAVALGMVGISRFARRRGWLEDKGLVARLERLLGRLSLPVGPPPGLDRAALAAAIGFDKKRERGKVRLAVPRSPGNVELRSLPIDEVPELVDSLYPEP